MDDLLLIGGMFLVTYIIRYLPFAYAHRIDFPAWLQQALEFVPIAALTAIIAPLIVYPDGELNLSLGNEYITASLVAGLVALRTKSQLATVISGLLVFFVSRLI